MIMGAEPKKTGWCFFVLKDQYIQWDPKNPGGSIQENYNTPLEHTPTNPPGQL